MSPCCGSSLTVERLIYDASQHSGLRFWAKSNAGALKLRVEFTTTASRVESEGGTCEGDLCNDHWGEYVDLTSGWEQSVPKDLAHLWTIQLVYMLAPFNPDDPGNPFSNPTSFEFVIDDVAFW